MLEDPAHWIQRVGTLAWSTLPKGSRCIPLKAIRAPAKGRVPLACACEECLQLQIQRHNSFALLPPQCCAVGKAAKDSQKGSFFVSCRLAYPFQSVMPLPAFRLAALSSPRRAAMLKRCVRIHPFGSRQSEPSVLNPCSWRETSLQHHTPVSFFCKPKPKVLLIKET